MAEKNMKKQRKSALLALLDFDLSNMDSGETSSDESFKIENHAEDSDFGSSDGSDSENHSDDSEENSSDDEPKSKDKANDQDQQHNQVGTSAGTTTEKLLEHSQLSSSATAKLLSTLVCCVCLGDRSDDSNEIVECDGCKITVHEGCYGVSESVSVSSTVSSCSTEPWFCEACKVNVKPDCELCPNRGGIFKETDCGKWVHLVCALYVPGVAFGEVDQLSMVTLFEMQYNKWGAKLCSLCDDERFAQTGVCIGCDAGMCKTYFHVTCAQKAGFLSEAHHEEVDQADPFYAHCKVHSDKTLMKNRKRNYNALQMQQKRYETELEMNKNEKPTPEQERIERKLKKHRTKYTSNKLNRADPWVPTQKMPRLLTTSASACKKLMKKAELMGIDAAALEFQEAQIASLTDIRKKWHIPPAFSTEFVGYYLDRTLRINEMKTNLSKQVEVNKSLLTQQQFLRAKYDDAIKINQDVQQRQKDLIQEIEELHGAILQICPGKQLQSIESISRPVAAAVKVVSSSPTPTLSSTPPPQMITSRTMTVPTAAALKMGVGFPLQHLRKDDTGRILSTQCVSNNDELLNECGICKKCTEQHLLAKCDTCHLYYHLGCLNPPLSRHPKRSKLYAWQCSECDKSDDSAPENVIIPKGPRRSRIRYSKDGPIFPDPLHDFFGSEQSISMSRKSDEAPVTRPLNGSELEVKKEAVTAPPTPLNLSTESDLNTSAPINNQHGGIPMPKKRGRKPKAKPSLDPSTPIDLSSQESLAPSKDTSNENNPTKKQKMDELPKEKPPPHAITSDNSSPKVVLKKGRPKKEKPSIAEISKNLQKKHETTNNQQGLKPEVSLLDLSRKLEFPLEQYRTIADIPNSIPYPAPNLEMPKITDTLIPVFPINKSEPEVTVSLHHTSSEPCMNGIVMNGDGTSSSGHKHKKQKKNKRRRSYSPSSGDRAPSGKKHKKHKRKLHDCDDAPSQSLEAIRSPEQPRIKMKFCAKMVQAGDDQKIMWSLPNAVGSEAHRNHSSISLPAYPVGQPLFNSSSEDLHTHHEPMVSPTNGHGSTSPKKRKKPLSATKKARLLLNISPNKGISSPIIAPSHFSPTISPVVTAVSAPLPVALTPLTVIISCDVCQTPGSTQNLVKCDECQKNYHFTCLIPPLRKTPKKRGYSWHCADCDPTDHE